MYSDRGGWSETEGRCEEDLMDGVSEDKIKSFVVSWKARLKN